MNNRRRFLRCLASLVGLPAVPVDKLLTPTEGIEYITEASLKPVSMPVINYPAHLLGSVVGAVWPAPLSKECAK
jgi:hypothetical protein